MDAKKGSRIFIFYSLYNLSNTHQGRS